MGALEHSIRSGEAAFTHVHGVPFFQYLRTNADVQKRFDEAMARISDSDDAAIAAALDFKRFRRIVDVGGGRGGLLAQILARAPDALGVLFEQPQVLEQATRLQDAGLMGRADWWLEISSLQSRTEVIVTSSRASFTISMMRNASRYSAIADGP